MNEFQNPTNAKLNLADNVERWLYNNLKHLIFKHLFF